MSDRLPIILSATALLVAVLCATPIGEAAYDAVVPNNSVGAQQLRKGAVTNVKIRGDAVDSGKVKNRSLKAVDFAEGQLPAGAAGAAGAAGEKGGKGDTGAPGVSGYEIVNSVSAFDSTETKSHSASCPAGKKVIGGGASVNPSSRAALIGSNPDGPNSRWYATAREVVATTFDWNLFVWAICANIAP
jgi:hypothetical protein